MKFPFILLSFITAAAIAAEPPSRLSRTVVLDETGVANLGIETVQAEETSFSSTIFTLGEIDHVCESHAVLASRIPGRIAEVLAHEGEFVEKDQLLGRIESRQPGDPPPSIDLKAPESGLIIESNLHLGAPVEPDKDLMKILDLTHVWAIARVPQHQASILKEGLTADVKIPATGDEIHGAKFLRLGTGADPSKATVEAIFEFPNPEMKLRPGMRAEVSLIASQREGVISIPREALQGDRSNRYLFIKDYELANTFVRVPVTVGEMTSERVEILTGLLPGDEVVTRGSYSLSFAGKGNASLKEALDAAHGHPHKEDGTEMTKEEAAAEGSHGHGHESSANSPLTIFLAITCVVLLGLLIASPFFLKARAQA